MQFNKKIVILILMIILILFFSLLIINNNNKTSNINSRNIQQKDRNANLGKIIKNNNCVIPKRNNAKCSELSYKECRNNKMCYSKGNACLTPPLSYIETLGLLKENCRISGGEWDITMGMYFINKFGGCKCPTGSKKMFPEDGYCEKSILDKIKKKKLPDAFYKYFEPLHNLQYKFYTEPLEKNMVDGILIDPLIVSLKSDFANLDEAEYIACLYGGKIIGKINLIDGYQIEFGNKTLEEAKNIADEIEKEPTVDFVMLDVEMEDNFED